MRWIRKIKNHPKHGDNIDCHEFLLFPMTIMVETRWLENAHILYVYNPYYSLFNGWEPYKFLNK